MRLLPSLTKDKRIPYKFYFIVVLALILSMLLYVFPEDLDIIRYYESAEQAVTEYNDVIDFSKFWMEDHVDFMYPASLFIALKLGLPMDVITIFYMALYYIAIFEIIRKRFPYVRIPGCILFYVAMFAPFIWVQSISRNLAAIAFLYVAMNYMADGKSKVKVVFWLIASLFTHISMVMYIPAIIVALLIENREVNNKLIYFSIIVTLGISYIVPSQLLNLISSVLSGSDSRYAASYGAMETQGVLMAESIGYGDKLPIMFCFLYSIILLFLNKSKDFMYWMLYMLTLMLSFFILSSLMFTNRVIMLMPLFVAYNAYKVMTEGTIKSRKMLSLVSFVGCIVVFLHFYAYRMYFSF